MTQDLDTFITQFNGPVYGTALETQWHIKNYFK